MQIQLFIPDALLLTRTKEHHIPYSRTRTRTHTHARTHAAYLQHLTSSGCTTLAGSSYMTFTSSPTGSHSTLSHACTAAKILCFFSKRLHVEGCRIHPSASNEMFNTTRNHSDEISSIIFSKNLGKMFQICWLHIFNIIGLYATFSGTWKDFTNTTTYYTVDLFLINSQTEQLRN